MRMILAGVMAALFLGSGGVADNTVAHAPEADAENMMPTDGEGNVTTTVTNTSASAAGSDREALLAECTDQGRAILPAGTDVAALCGCAVDRHLAGTAQFEATRQCAAAQNVRLPMDR